MSSADAPHRDPSPLSRDQRIEQLLLAGLDRYFAGELERAIQVWSRVFFLDRGHARARAYIDRARGAIAERQREAEARAHRADPHGHGAVGASLAGADAGLPVALPSELMDAEISRSVAAAAGSVIAGAHAPTTIDAVYGSGARLARARTDVGAADLASETDLDTIGRPGDPVDDEPRARSRTLAHVLLVALAAVLLFGAGYVVAARDRLAAWWSTPAAPALSVPVMAPETSATPRAGDSPGAPSTPPRETATR
jgi:hypothetical protein